MTTTPATPTGPTPDPAPSSVANPTGAVTVAIGPDDHPTLEQVSRWIRGLITGGAQDLIVDVSDAHGHDERLLTVLVRTHAELAATGARLRVTGAAPPQVLEALQAARLHEMFLVYNALRPGRHGGRVPGRAIPGPTRGGLHVR